MICHHKAPSYHPYDNSIIGYRCPFKDGFEFDSMVNCFGEDKCPLIKK